MNIFKASPLGIAILSVACGTNIDTKTRSTGNARTISNTISIDTGATSDAGGTNQAPYTGGLTLILPINNPVKIENGGPPSCGWFYEGFEPDSGCARQVPINDAGLTAYWNDRMTILVIYVVASLGDRYVVGQSEPDCLQGDGWYLGINGTITLCPKTCVTVQQNPNAVIEVSATPCSF